MSDPIKQTQKAGGYSTNLQAKTVEIHQHGITISEARQIALDVFKANALELAGVAKDLFEARGREFIDRYLDELQKRNPEAIGSFRDPDMQYSLFLAQRDYARSGDKGLGELLLDLLTARAVQKDRNLLQLTLAEALSTASKLTLLQCDILSLCFVVRYSTKVQDLGRLAKHFTATVFPLAIGFPLHHAPYQHLQYAGCASYEVAQITIPHALHQLYPGLFYRGFSLEEFRTIVGHNQRVDRLLIPAFHNRNLFQLASLDLEACQSAGVPQEE